MNTKDKLHFKTLDKMWSLTFNTSSANKKSVLNKFTSKEKHLNGL